MLGLPRQASVLWSGVIAVSVACLAASAWAGAGDLRTAPVAALFAVAYAIAETFNVMLPTSRPGHSISFSLAGAVSIAAVLVLPMHWATLVVGAGMLIGNRTAWFKRVYNASELSLAAAASAFIWRNSPASSPSDVSAVPWVIGAVAAFYVVTSVLTSSIVAFASGMPVRVTWLRGTRHTWPAYLGMLFIGVLVAILWQLSPWTMALAAIPLTAVYYALRNTVTLETQTVDALFNLADILDARDPYTHGHSLRVGEYAEKLALALGLSGDEAHLIFLAGRLHDIGKCAIRNEVLLKPGALNDEERAHMCIHPEVGSSMLASFSLFSECARYVRGHHERWDGQGYPDRLRGDAIPLGARIIAVADAFDAMTTTRPYRKALPIAEAYRRLQEGAGTQWDPRAVTAFLKLLDTTSLGQPEPLALPTEPAESPLQRAA